MMGRRVATASAMSSARRLVTSRRAAGSDFDRTIRVPAAWYRSTGRPSAGGRRRCPIPMPVGDWNVPASTASRFAMPGPLSSTTTRSCCGRASRSRSNWTPPPAAYRNALRTISETAVAMRVCSGRRNRAGLRSAPRFAARRRRLRRGGERVTLVDAYWGIWGRAEPLYSPRTVVSRAGQAQPSR